MIEQHSDNVFALDARKKMVHVLDVPKGRNNYTCGGCKREVIAIHRSKDSWKPYFRHHITDVKYNRKCTYRDETHRHKLAKDILQRIKKVRVPGVKKNPPKGMEGEPMIISKPRTIEAKTVLIERQFYEGEDNLVHYGPNPTIKVREHLIKPDVTFLDENNIPILFIEIEATHEVKQAKFLKIKRLGINTIQVKIPKDSEQEIEKCFSTVKHTKWIYNDEYESTTYVPNSRSHPTALSAPDEFQEGVYEENLSCRRAEIGNLIRAIDRCIESEHYSRNAKSAETELRNAESITSRLRKRYDRIRREAEARAFEPFEKELASFEDKRRNIEQKEAELEARYRARRDELEEELESAQSKYKSRIKELGGKRRSLEERERELKNETEYSERIIQDVSGDITRTEQAINESPEKFRSDIRSLGENYRNKIGNLKNEIEPLGRQLEDEEGRIEKEEREIDQRFGQLENELRERYTKRAESFTSAVRERNAEGDDPGIAKLRRILRKHQQFQSIINLQESIKRARAARKWFESAPWKDWS